MSKNTLLVLAAVGAIATLILIVSIFRTPPAGGVPPAASGLTAANVPDASTPSIKLTWADNSTNETGFKVLRQPSGAPSDPYTLVTTAVANATTYVDGGLTNFWEYNYEIVATNAAGDAPPSNIVKVQAQLAATTPPPDGGTPPTGGPPPAGGISVKDHGAKGDGTTDDKAAIQNTINACTASVLFPAGTYKVSGTLSLKANCTYYGEGGAKLVGYTGTGAGGFSIAKTAGNNIKVQSLTFEGGGLALDTEMQNHLTITGNKFQNIYNTNTNFGSHYAGVWIGGTLLDSSIDHNTFSHIMDANNNAVTDGQLGGIRGYRLSRVNIVDNTFDFVQQGISISQSQAAEETLASYDNVHISRNRFTNVRRMPMEFQAHKLKGWVVEDNVMSWLAPVYWNSFAISAAWDGATTATIRRNKADISGLSGGAGYCLEIAGVETVVDANECRGTGQWKVGVMIGNGPNAKVSNNLLCGGFSVSPTAYENPHVDQSGHPASFVNNSTPATCP